MARKRHIRSHLKGTSKKVRKSMGSRRKYRTGRTRLPPEVKYTNTGAGGNTLNFTGSATTITSTDIKRLNNFPTQGTTDTNRIGDTIMGKKLYIRLNFWQDNTRGAFSGIIRIIIFNMKTPPSPDIANFWQALVAPQALAGVVNREVVNKVFYDKQFVLQGPIPNKGTYYKTKSINISMKWPIVFAGGVTNPKDPRNEIFMTTIGYNADVAAGDVLATYAASCNMYYTDS